MFYYTMFKVILCYYFLLNNIMSEETIVELDKDKKTNAESQSNDFLNQASLDYLINTKLKKIKGFIEEES